MPSPRLSGADYLQRATVLTCVGLGAYGVVLIAHGATVKVLRYRAATRQALEAPPMNEPNPFASEQAAGSLSNSDKLPS